MMMKQFLRCPFFAIVTIAIVICNSGCVYFRDDRVNYYFTIHSQEIIDKNDYSEKVFLVVKKTCEKYDFKYLGLRDQDGKEKAYLFYNKSMNIPCYYTWDSMRITIKTQPCWRAGDVFLAFLDALRDELRKNGFKYQYERKLFPILFGGVVNFSGEFVTENDEFATEYHQEEI